VSKFKSIIDFKKYLSKDNPLTKKLYFGNIDHEPDEGLESALKILEMEVSKKAGASIEGMLWTKKGLNPNATVQDLHRSIELVVKSQATLDAIGPPTGDVPSAVNFSNTPPGYLEEVDPDNSQRTGVLTQNMPESFAADSGEVEDEGTIDERVLEMIELLSQ